MLGLAPALVALRDSDLAAYHGVEHKAIGGYEQGRADPREVPKEHERCGSHLIAPMLVLSVAGQLVVERAARAARAGRARRSPALAGVVARGRAVRLERAPSRLAARRMRLRRPGTEIQRLVATREPTDEQLEVGIAALAEILARRERGARPDRRSQPC